MLGLQCDTNPQWLKKVEGNIPAILVDHAHCEKKAATMAISLLNRYPDKAELVREMSELAIEEMSHFRMVLRHMEERSIPFAHDPGDNYAQALHTQIRKQEPHRLLDTLIVSSLIEARSCERFKLLSESIADEDLSEFYRSLLASEARHRNEFIRLAKLYFPDEVVDMRLTQMENFEAEIVGGLTNSPMMHG
jgi:tRNA 2-(methylsulfanyl)-N6-isopentenyladenosine37 hydroxylase